MRNSNRSSSVGSAAGLRALCLLTCLMTVAALAVVMAAPTMALARPMGQEEAPSQTPAPSQEPAPEQPPISEVPAPDDSIDTGVSIETEVSSEDPTSEAVAVEVIEAVEATEERSSRSTRRQRVNKDTQVHFMSDLEIGEDEVAREAVVLMGSLRIKGKVLGDAVSIGGPTFVDGEVTGTVTAVLDSVYLGPESEVLGDVISIGGTVEMDPGARVLGEVSEVDFGPALHFSQVPWAWDDDWGFWNEAPLGIAWSIFWTVFRWIVLILIVSFVFLVARQAVENTAASVSSEPWKAGLLGLAALLLFFPLMVVVTIVLALSIIGIPLLIIVWPVALFALMVACLLGYTASAYAVGGWLGRRFGWDVSAWVGLMIGVVAIQSLSLLAAMFGSFGGFFWFFALMFGLVGWLVRFSAWTAGLGAAIMTYAERRNAAKSYTPPPVQTTEASRASTDLSTRPAVPSSDDAADVGGGAENSSAGFDNGSAGDTRADRPGGDRPGE